MMACFDDVSFQEVSGSDIAGSWSCSLQQAVKNRISSEIIDV
jgi:hypothetical protein